MSETTEVRREDFRRYARAARDAADAMRGVQEIASEVWIDAEWLANELASFDLDLAADKVEIRG